MRWPAAVPLLIALAFLTSCVTLKFGREFRSPDAKQIAIGKTDKASLLRMFGEPYQAGLDGGDQTWRWFYGMRDGNVEISKDLTVRFNAEGIVKGYAFTSNFPDDMQHLK